MHAVVRMPEIHRGGRRLARGCRSVAPGITRSAAGGAGVWTSLRADMRPAAEEAAWPDEEDHDHQREHGGVSPLRVDGDTCLDVEDADEQAADQRARYVPEAPDDGRSEALEPERVHAEAGEEQPADEHAGHATERAADACAEAH